MDTGVEPTVLRETRDLLAWVRIVGAQGTSVAELETARARLHALAHHPSCDDTLRARTQGALLVVDVLLAGQRGARADRST